MAEVCSIQRERESQTETEMKTEIKRQEHGRRQRETEGTERDIGRPENGKVQRMVRRVREEV